MEGGPFGPVANGPLGPPIGAAGAAGEAAPDQLQAASSSADKGGGEGAGGAPTPTVRKNFPETWIWVDVVAK